MAKINTKLKKDDTVTVIAGKNKGKEGKITEIDRTTGRVIVDGVNVQKKTLKKTQENPNGGITEKEAAIHISNVAFMEDGKPVKLGYKIEDGKKVRVSRKSGKAV